MSDIVISTLHKHVLIKPHEIATVIVPIFAEAETEHRVKSHA